MLYDLKKTIGETQGEMCVLLVDSDEFTIYKLCT